MFGNDRDVLRQIGVQIQAIANTIPRLEECKLDQQSVIRQPRIEIDRDRAAAYGITPGRLNATLSMLLGGEKLASLREGPREIDLTLRLPLVRGIITVNETQQLLDAKQTPPSKRNAVAASLMNRL